MTFNAPVPMVVRQSFRMLPAWKSDVGFLYDDSISDTYQINELGPSILALILLEIDVGIDYIPHLQNDCVAELGVRRIRVSIC